LGFNSRAYLISPAFLAAISGTPSRFRKR
jgi:hypothetical protein